MRAPCVVDVALALGTLACAGATVQTKTPRILTCVHYDPEIVTLNGKLITVPKYGPPNFGESPETDARLSVPILVLSRPVDVCGDSTSEINTSSFHGVKELQVIFHDSLGARPFLDQNVIATGTLFEHHTMNHYTDVLLSLKTIRVSP